MLRQTQRSWVSSPIGINHLLSIIKNNDATNKYLKIGDLLKEKNGFKNETLYLTNVEKIKNDISNVKTIKVEDRNEAVNILHNWVNDKRCDFNVPLKDLPWNKKWMLANVSSYKGMWKKGDISKMKVYNSFNYTDDIKYETRLLERPLHDEDFKLIVVVPNEIDVMDKLMDTLITDGLQTTITKLQPSFTTESVLKALDIEFTSEPWIKQNKSDITMFEYGNVKINEKELSVNVFTGMSPGEEKISTTDEQPEEEQNKFFFAIIFRDTAIITGQYIND